MNIRKICLIWALLKNQPLTFARRKKIILQADTKMPLMFNWSILPGKTFFTYVSQIAYYSSKISGYLEVQNHIESLCCWVPKFSWFTHHITWKSFPMLISESVATRVSRKHISSSLHLAYSAFSRLRSTFDYGQKQNSGLCTNHSKSVSSEIFDLLTTFVLSWDKIWE